MKNTTSGKTGFRLQTPLTLQIFVFTFIGFFATNLVNVLGVVGYAAYHMQNQINYVLNAFIFGIAGTMSVMCNK